MVSGCKSVRHFFCQNERTELPKISNSDTSSKVIYLVNRTNFTIDKCYGFLSVMVSIKFLLFH